MTGDHPRTGISRGTFLRTIGLGAGAVALGDYGLAHATPFASPASARRDFTLNAGDAHFNLGGKRISTIAYNGLLPGPMIRVKRGERLRVQVNNHLGADTTVHWHGIPIVNKMDGVPGVTQPAIKAGTNFLYDFNVPVSGTYWYHSHNEIQLDRGLYGPLIIDEPNEKLSYDREAILALDDWRDIGSTHLTALQSKFYCDVATYAGTGGFGMSGNAFPTQPARYPLHLINGRPGNAPTEIRVKRGDVLRLRLINAAGGTVYRFAIAGHRMRVTHTDGNPVQPVDVDALDIGMAERYDVLVYATNPGVWQMAAQVAGEGVRTRAILRYEGSHAHVPPATSRPGTLEGKLLSYPMLNATSDVALPSGKPDLDVHLGLNTKFGSFWITWNGQIVDAVKPIHIPLNSHVRFRVTNGGTTQPHPIHLHGHSFKLSTGSGGSAYKDTAIVLPSQTLTYDWIADNPGVWMLHCHNLYHMLAGMMLLLRVK